MSKIDESQLNRNRRVMAESTVESPYNAVMDDSENDIPEHLYDSVPKDPSGLMPPGTKE
jgi:hypothetical protein